MVALPRILNGKLSMQSLTGLLLLLRRWVSVRSCQKAELQCAVWLHGFDAVAACLATLQYATAFSALWQFFLAIVERVLDTDIFGGMQGKRSAIASNGLFSARWRCLIFEVQCSRIKVKADE